MTEFLSDAQQEDLQFFYNKLDELLKEPLLKHKFLVIHDKKIEGAFDSFENAVTNAASRFQPYEFVIQQVISDTEVSGFLYPAYEPEPT